MCRISLCARSKALNVAQIPHQRLLSPEDLEQSPHRIMIFPRLSSNMTDRRTVAQTRKCAELPLTGSYSLRIRLDVWEEPV